MDCIYTYFFLPEILFPISKSGNSYLTSKSQLKCPLNWEALIDLMTISSSRPLV